MDAAFTVSPAEDSREVQNVLAFSTGGVPHAD
jgi:hypothetical protein